VRLLERLGATAVCLCDAAWKVVAFNGAWAALRCGEPTGHAWDGNLAWRTFGHAPGRVAERAAGFKTMLAARLRTASLRYPADTSLAALVDELPGHEPEVRHPMAHGGGRCGAAGLGRAEPSGRW
jgi:MmyB-like transcription regulator ligand binding domain